MIKVLEWPDEVKVRAREAQNWVKHYASQDVIALRKALCIEVLLSS